MKSIVLTVLLIVSLSSVAHSVCWDLDYECLSNMFLGFDDESSSNETGEEFDVIKNISQTVQGISNFLENNRKPNGTNSENGKPNNQTVVGMGNQNIAGSDSTDSTNKPTASPNKENKETDDKTSTDKKEENAPKPEN